MDNELSVIIGNRINTLLAEQGKKQKELSEYLGGIPENTISYFCSGKRIPNTSQIKKIAEYFNVSADYLLGITKVKNNDKDLRFICEYTGLDEETVKSLKINEFFKVPIGDNDVFDKRALFMGFAYDKYAEMYRESFDELIQSSCLLDIVTSCCTEKLLEYCYKEIMQFIGSERPLNTVSKYTIDKLKVYIDIFNGYSRQHLLNMFCAQNSVIEFVKETTVLDDYDSDMIEDIKHQVLSLELEISEFSSDDKVQPSDSENKKILGYSIEDIDSIVDYYLDHRETEKSSTYDFIKGHKAFQSEEECKEYAERMQTVIEERENDGNNSET